MFVVGLTGGIASGKSTVSQIFRDQGIPVIDADAVARKVVEPGQPAYAQLRAEFGSAYFDDDNGGILMRKKLGEMVFRDDQKRRRLNQITHPAIRWEMLKQFFAILFAGNNFCILDTPLLYEVGYDKILPTVIVAYCTDEQQVVRMMGRDNCTEQEARERIASQMKLEEKRKRATILIDNQGTMEELEAKTLQVIAELRSRWTPHVIRLGIACAVGLISYFVLKSIGVL